MNVQAVDYLNSLPLLKGLPAGCIETLAGNAFFQDFRLRDPIFFAGDDADHGYFVVSGHVVLFKSSPDGKELIVELALPGEPFGIIAVFDAVAFPLSARAQAATKVLAIKREEIVRALQNFPDLRHFFSKLIAARLRQAHEIMRALAHDSVENRIASVLLSLEERFSKGGFPNIPLTRKELAELCGTSLETAIRVTKSLEADGILDLGKTRQIKITSVDKLRAFCSYS